MEILSLKNVSLNSKVDLLKELGYDSDLVYVLDTEGNKLLDRYMKVPVNIRNMLILPRDIIILDNNELSIAKYMKENPEILNSKDKLEKAIEKKNNEELDWTSEEIIILVKKFRKGKLAFIHDINTIEL